MKRFKYKTVTRDLNIFDNDSDFEKELNTLGDNGWKIVTTLGSNKYNRECILMEKETDDKEESSRQGY